MAHSEVDISESKEEIVLKIEMWLTIWTRSEVQDVMCEAVVLLQLLPEL